MVLLHLVFSSDPASIDVFLCCHLNGKFLRYIVSKLRISILIKWCTGNISNRVGNVFKFSEVPPPFWILTQPVRCHTVREAGTNSIQILSYVSCFSTIYVVIYHQLHLQGCSQLQVDNHKLEWSQLYYYNSLCTRIFSSHQDLSCGMHGQICR